MGVFCQTFKKSMIFLACFKRYTFFLKFVFNLNIYITDVSKYFCEIYELLLDIYFLFLDSIVFFFLYGDHKYQDLYRLKTKCFYVTDNTQCKRPLKNQWIFLFKRWILDENYLDFFDKNKMIIKNHLLMVQFVFYIK